MKLFSARTALLTFVAVLAGAGVLLFSVVTASAQDPLDTSINENDLPKNAEVSPNNGYIHEMNMSHPLSKYEEPDTMYAKYKATPDVYDYSSVYMFSALLRDQGCYVADYLYTYKDPAQAQRAAAQFAQILVNAAPIQAEHSTGTSQNKGLTGDVITVVNPEDGVEIVWFVATNDNVLSLVIVDGVDSETNKAVFRSVLDMRQN